MIQKGIEIPLIQGTEQWKQWRLSGIGGSDAAIIQLGNVYGKTPLTLWMEKTGQVETKDEEFESEHVKRGQKLEPKARQDFIEHTGIVVEPACFQSVLHPFMLASMDGMSLDRTVGVELKSHSDDVFKAVCDEGIPDYYYPQIQHQYAVSGAREIYYYGFNENVPPYRYIELVLPDYGYIENLIRREYNFFRHVENNIPPHGNDTLQNSNMNFVGLIMLGGFATVGKDEVIGKIYQKLLGVKRFSPSDPLRHIYCEVMGITPQELNDEKELHRPALVALGHGMRQYVPDVWIDAVFNPRTGIYEAMKTKGAMITSTRYVNEVSRARQAAADLDVMCRVIYIDRPGIKAANETEAKSLQLVKQVSDVILVNDLDINISSQYFATEAACLSALSLPDARTIIKASDYLEIGEYKAKKERKNNDRKRKVTSPTTRKRSSIKTRKLS